MTTSATLRSLTSIGAVVSGSGSGARRRSSCTRSGIWLLRSAFAALRLRQDRRDRRGGRDGETGAALQRLVDRHRRLRTFGCGDDDELHVARGVADDVKAGDMGLAEIVGFHRPAVIHVASESRGNLALLALAARKEYGVAPH